MHHCQIFPVLEQPPPLNELVMVYVARHDQRWSFARLIAPDMWEIDSRTLPSHVAVDTGLITHWMPEPASPFDTFSLDVSEPLVIDAPARRIESTAAQRLKEITPDNATMKSLLQRSNTYPELANGAEDRPW